MSESQEGQPLPTPQGAEATQFPLRSFDWESKDRELQTLGLVAARAATPAIVEDLAVVHERFDTSATYRHRGGTTTEVTHDGLRKVLRALPPYLESAAQIAMAPAQAYLLLRGMMTAENRDRDEEFGPPVGQLTKAFTWQGRHGHQLHHDDQADLGRFLAAASDKNEDMLVTRVYAHLSRLGFTSAQSTGFIEQDLYMNNAVLDKVGILAHTLYGAAIEPAVLRESCTLMLGDGDDYNRMVDNFAILTEMVYQLVPSLDITANDLLSTVNARMRAGESVNSIAATYTGDENRTAIAGATVYDPQKRRNKHFTLQPAGQSLELAALPQRVERSLADGMADLGRIAVDKVEYGEGLWVFASDAAVPTWYSLGGQTVPDLARGAVGYQYLPYPIGEISDRPYVFHCHPEVLAEIGNPGPTDGTFPPRAIPVIDRLTTLTPSGRDYQLVAEFLREASGPSSIRSFIAHGRGFTEYTFPNDPDAIEEVGHNVRAWRGEVLLEVDWERLLTVRKLAGLRRSPREPNEAAAELVGRLDQRLPKGFSLRLIAPEDLP